MRTKEFIKRVKELGFKVEIELGEIRIGDGEGDFVVIWPKFTFAISTIEDGFMDLKDPLPLKKLYKLCFEYASTPVKDREEEKKFYLKHRWLESIGNRYLITDLGDGYYYLGDKDDFVAGKLQFTLKEIEDIKEKFDTDLNDFELVEVDE